MEKPLWIDSDNSGQLAAPPMPQYRFKKEDGAAVLAYLRSLKK